ncbi:unnamed protein product [Triticum turgidum subsp. durum]|uniref:Uncharacterized protein n=1 Tax=Triticum turgidum subsp. durum TaxID=4567 RepID=A0A9R1P4W8_TRITD|nr:unnamed protein product [Triticum turgidum subsp. durum]
MEGEGSWRFLYDSDSDDELLRFARGDTAVPAERQQQQQVQSAHDGAQPAYPVAIAAADAQHVVSDQRMMAHLSSASAMQLDRHQAPPLVHVQQPQPAPPMPMGHQQEPSMVRLQYPQPAPAMAFEPQQAPSMVYSRYPQPAPAMPLQHQPGESPAAVPLHVGQHQHMMGESSSAMPLHHQQMLVDSPATMQIQHQQMQGLSEPTPESGLHNDQIPKPSQEGGEGLFFAPAPQPGDDSGPSGAASIPAPETPATPPAVAPAQPEQESLRDLTPESAPEYVESCILKMRNKTGPLEDVISGSGAASSTMIRAPPGDAGSPWAPERGTRRRTFSTTSVNLQ